MLEMTEVILDTRVAALINEIKNFKLTTFLLMEPLEDVEDMMDRTKKYMSAEEALALKYVGREQEKKVEKEESRKRINKIPRREEKERYCSLV